MAINVDYSAINWQNKPSTASPINATNLNKMDTELGNAISALNGLSKSDIGLGNVDNTSDANKPISNATQTALNNKVDKIVGKGLSTNDYTSAEKTKLAGIEANANKTIVDSILSSSSTNPVQNKVVNEFKLDKGETAVSAKGIILATPVREEAPYVYRQTPVASSLNAKMHSIIGCSVAWNQYVQNGNFANGSQTWSTNIGASFENNTATLRASAQYQNLGKPISSLSRPSHKLLGICKGQSYIDTNTFFYLRSIYSGNMNKASSVTLKTTKGIFTTILDVPDQSSYIQVLIQDNNTSNWGDIVISSIQLFDLTQMFGTTIADYVYTLEQATAGSGIAWLQSYGFFTEDYYAYDTGGIQSVNVSKKNIYDENDNLISSYSFDSSKTLRGLVKLATNKLKYDGDIYNSNGSLTRKYGFATYDGSNDENWQYNSGSNGYFYLDPRPTNIKTNALIMCDKLITVSDTTTFSNNEGVVYCASNMNIKINSSTKTVEALRSWLSSNPLTVVYELATTTSETANPFIENEKVGTEEFIDYGVSQNTRDVAIPVGTETDYYQGMELPPLPTASGNHNLQYNPSTGFSWS